MIKFIIQGQSGYVYRGDDSYLLGQPIGIPLERLVDEGYTGLERSIKVHVRNLRKKIEADPSQPIYIESVFGVGYRFCS